MLYFIIRSPFLFRRFNKYIPFTGFRRFLS
nr:MAG TPA: hypothetical protein [Caudoviricetes sp.]